MLDDPAATFRSAATAMAKALNTLLEGPGRMRYHSDLRLLFEAMGGHQRQFDWLVTNLELNYYPPGLSYVPPPDKPRWLTGAELDEIVRQHDVQFIWAVLSGFRPGIELDLSRLQPCPYADGNAELWLPGVRIQHPQAEIEIVCWDSSSTLILTHDEALTRRIRAFFPEARDLDEQNART